MPVVYRVGASGGALRSSGDWDAWDALSAGFSSSTINAIAVSALGRHLAVSTQGKARSTEDSGDSWTAIATSGYSSSGNITAVGSGYQTVVVGGRNFDNNPLVRRNVTTWTTLATVTASGVTGAITDIQVTNSTTWHLLSGAGIHRSTDDGATWAAPVSVLSAGVLTRVAAYDNTLVAVGVETGGGLRCAKSADAGATWTEFSLDSASEAQPSVATNGHGAWLIASGNKLFRSTDNAVTWTEKTLSGVDAATGCAGVECWGGVWMWCPLSTGNVWRSTDNGKTWAEDSGSGSAFVVHRTGHIKAAVSRSSTAPDLNPEDPPAPEDPKVWLVGGLVGGEGILHRSEDGGVTWDEVFVADDFPGVFAIESDDLGRWIIACVGNTLFRSIDNGLTWTFVDPDLPSGSPVRCIAAGGDGVWILGGDNGALSRSADHGQTWNPIAHGLEGAIGTPRIQGVETDRAGTWVAVTGNFYVLRSTDNGLTWTQSLPETYAGSGWTDVETDRADKWVIVGDVSDEFLESLDNGATWSIVPGFFSSASSSMTYSAKTDRSGTWLITTDVYARRKSVENVGFENVWYTTTLDDIRSAATDGEGVWLFAGEVGSLGPVTLLSGPLYRSANNGTSFTTLSVTDTTAVAYGAYAEELPVDPDPDPDPDPEPEPDPKIWIATGDSGKVRRSVNHGVTWAAVDPGFTAESVFAAAADASGVVLVGGEAGEMRRSADQGATWATVDPGFGVSDIRGIATDQHGIWVAVGAAGKIARSEDGGVTWGPITTSLGGTADFEAVATNRTGVWVAVGKFGDLILSTNNGASWLTVDSGFTEDIHTVAYRSGVWVAAGFGGQMRRSLDNGLTWTEVGAAVGILQAVATSGSAWVVAGWLGEMLRSADAGATWAAVDSDFGTAGVNALAAAPDGVWVSGGDDALFLRRSANDGVTWNPVDCEFDGGDFVHAICYIPESTMDFDEDTDLESIASGDDEYEHDGDAEFLLSEGDGLPEEIFISSTATLYSNGSSSDYTVVATVKDLTSEAAATDEISEFSTYTLESAGVADDEISSTTDSAHDLLSEASGLGTVSEYHALDLTSEGVATDEISEEAAYDLLSEATADDEISGFAASFEDLLSAASADDELFAGGTTTVNVDEVAFGESETFVHNPGAVAWVLNTESNGVSWYSNYHFTGIAQVGDRVLMVGPMGLCEVTGGLDIDDDIQANVTYGFVDFGDEQKKRIDRLNFGYTADGLLQATVETYGQGYPAYTYEMEARTAEMPRNNRIRPGKGLNARYWRIGIENVDGCAFSVEDISADIVPSARRL